MNSLFKPSLRGFTHTVLVFTLAMSIPSVSQGQMVTGQQMENFTAVFGLTRADFSAQQTDCSLGANVLWPGDEVEFTFFIKPEAAYEGTLHVRVIQYGTRGKPGDMWRPVVFKIADVNTQTITVDLPVKGAMVKVAPKIGSAYGGYGVVLEIPGKGRIFGCTCVRVLRPEPGRVYEPTYALDLPWPHEMSPKVYNVFKRLGVKGARVEGGYGTIKDAHIDWALENDITLMLTVGCGNTPREHMPLGRGRPWLKDSDEMIEGIKEDLAWLPSFDPTFEAYLKNVLCEYGWPKGPINAVELWNEPWEGVSISGWGADALRYRELYRHMARAVLTARKEAGVKVLVGGACSSSNTRDKLFCDGTDEFLPVLDFVSIHYQPLGADPALVPQWLNRKSEYGPVRCWDTESWVANSEDRVAAVIASMRAMGQQRTAGIYRGNVYDSQKPRINGIEYAVAPVWSPGAAVAATQAFIGQRDFQEILFKNGLPWIFVFDGLARFVNGNPVGPTDPDDGTVVIVGDLKASYPDAKVLFRSVGMAKGASLTLANPDGLFVLYDFYGNPVPSTDQALHVPINDLGFFVRTDGSTGSFEKLVQAIRQASITGIDPVEIIVSDMTQPIETQPTLTLRLTNVLNRPVNGTCTLEAENLQIKTPKQTLRLKPHETREMVFQVQSGQVSPENRYASIAAFESQDGTVTHAEVIHVNALFPRSITLDGDLNDWQGIIPQQDAQPVGVSDTEKAYLPFKDWSVTQRGGDVTARLAYDKNFFYFSAIVPKIEPMIRFETRDDDLYFYPETVTNQGKKVTWPDGVRRFSYRRDPDLPAGNGQYNVQIAFNVLPPDQKALLPFPKGTMPKFCAYPDTDYEYALNLCQDGGTEIFCLTRPGAPRKHFYPRQPKAPMDGGPVKGTARLAIQGNHMECAIPWSEMPEVKARMDQDKTLKFSFRVNQGGEAFELAAGRSVSKDNSFAFHNDWATHWANELVFGVVAWQ